MLVVLLMMVFVLLVLKLKLMLVLVLVLVTETMFSKYLSCRRFVSGSKDGDVRVWDVVTSSCIRTLTSHTASVTSVRWGGSG